MNRHLQPPLLMAGVHPVDSCHRRSVPVNRPGVLLARLSSLGPLTVSPCKPAKKALRSRQRAV